MSATTSIIYEAGWYNVRLKDDLVIVRIESGQDWLQTKLDFRMEDDRGRRVTPSFAKRDVRFTLPHQSCCLSYKGKDICEFPRRAAVVLVPVSEVSFYGAICGFDAYRPPL